MAKLGDMTVNIRLRVEAGVGNAMTDVGHADLEIKIPVTAEATDTGISMALDTSHLRTQIADAIQAFADTAHAAQG